MSLLCRIEHVIRGHAVNAYRDRGEVDIHHGPDIHRVGGSILCAGCNVERTVRPLADIRRRHSRFPGSVGQDRGDVLYVVNGHGNGAARGQIGAGTGNNEILPVLDDIDNIVARHGINTQTRQLGVDGEVQRGRTGVSVRIRHAGRNRQLTVTERG